MKIHKKIEILFIFVQMDTSQNEQWNQKRKR